jgi:hypothetical protein
VVVGVGALASGGGGIGTGWTGAASATATATGAASEGTGCTGCWRAGGLGADHDHGARQHRRRRRRARRSMDQTRQGVCRRSQREGGITNTHGAVQSSRWRLAALGRVTDAMRARGSRKEQGIRRRIRRQTQMQRDGGLQTNLPRYGLGLLVGSLDLPARSPALPRLLQAAATGILQAVSR